MKDILKFLLEIGKLKRMPRRGWVLIGAKNPETIAAHTFHKAIMAWILVKEKRINFNIERILKLALVHDLCELYAGDPLLTMKFSLRIKKSGQSYLTNGQDFQNLKK